MSDGNTVPAGLTPLFLLVSAGDTRPSLDALGFQLHPLGPKERKIWGLAQLPVPPSPPKKKKKKAQILPISSHLLNVWFPLVDGHLLKYFSRGILNGSSTNHSQGNHYYILKTFYYKGICMF